MSQLDHDMRDALDALTASHSADPQREEQGRVRLLGALAAASVGGTASTAAALHLVEEAGVLGAPALGGGTAAASATGTTIGAATATTLGAKLVLGAALALCAAGGVYVAAAPPQSSAGGPTAAGRAPHSTAPRSAAGTAGVGSRAAAGSPFLDVSQLAIEALPAAPTVSTTSPAAANRPRSAASATAAAPKPRGAHGLNVAAEAALIRRALLAKDRGDTAAARAFLGEHQRRFAAGALSAERERALRDLGPAPSDHARVKTPAEAGEQH